MVQSVVRAMALLEHLEAAGAEGLALQELARRAELKPPTAHNLLRTLEALGYVAQAVDSRRYALGPRAVSLGRAQTWVERLQRLAMPLVGELQRRVDETVQLTVYRAGRRHTLCSAESAQPLRVGAQQGPDDRFYDTATGRMLLALLPAAERVRVVAELGPPESRWPAAAADPAAALEGLLTEGHARFENRASHVVALAVPVPSPAADCPAALGLYLPEARWNVGREAVLVEALRETASRIALACERIMP